MVAVEEGLLAAIRFGGRLNHVQAALTRLSFFASPAPANKFASPSGQKKAPPEAGPVHDLL